MNSRLLLFLVICIFPLMLSAQDTTKPVTDTANTGRTVVRKPAPKPVVVPDSTRRDSSIAIASINIDTSLVSPRMPTVFQLFPVSVKHQTIYGQYVGGYMKVNEQFNVTAPVRRVPELLRTVVNKDWVFYFYCGLLLVLAYINLAFHKYFVDLFRVFFNTSMRQKQLREQLSQSPLPSLLLNILFCINGALFTFFILKHFGIITGFPPALEILIVSGILGAAYAIKYIFVTMLGWMFDRRHAAENYVFTVMLVNKVAGLLLLPIGILMAYGDRVARDVVLTLTLILLIVLVIMRLAKCFLAIRDLKVNLIQFLAFVGAFEIIPAMLVYKVLLRVFE
jgi:hypothetical protein